MRWGHRSGSPPLNRASSMEELKGKVQTVLGPVDASKLGITLTHEHILVDFSAALMKPEYGCDCLSDLDLKMENLGKVRHFPFSVRANLTLENEEEASKELKLFKLAGGGAVCDVTTLGIRTKPEALPRISQETELKIITGTGFYVGAFLSEEIQLMSIPEMTNLMVKEIIQGIGDSGVKCGVIGEIGCSWPLAEVEKKALQAAAHAQQETGAPLIIHPGRNERAPFEILDILEASGADISHTVMSHLDRTFYDNAVLLEFAKRGCYLEYDVFGIECSHNQLVPDRDFPSDAQKIQKVKLLVDSGYTHKILLAHDICTKHRLTCYGGHGYAHILENIVPKMQERGMSRDVIMQILTQNPQNWLVFV